MGKNYKIKDVGQIFTLGDLTVGQTDKLDKCPIFDYFSIDYLYLSYRVHKTNYTITKSPNLNGKLIYSLDFLDLVSLYYLCVIFNLFFD